MGILLHTMNVWRFSKLWTAVTLAFIGISTWNLQTPFYRGKFTFICVKFLQKKSSITIFDDIIVNQEYPGTAGNPTRKLTDNLLDILCNHTCEGGRMSISDKSWTCLTIKSQFLVKIPEQQ